MNNEIFDFIVVGAGSAGSVVANRLSEDPSQTVLLLEAGDNPTNTSEMPALFPHLQKTELDWQYKTDPEENNCLGMKGRRCNWPAGKVLGGSSTINYMLYVRGNQAGYNQWAADGNKGWAYYDVLPYFKKSEDMRAIEVAEGFYHSKGGPLKVDTWQIDNVKPVACAFKEAMNELGYPLNLDVNGPSQAGFVHFQGTLDNGKRCSTARAFLSPIANRKNLKVSKQSLATQILIDANNIAYGVQYINRNGETLSVQAAKEVILSAGAIRSPHLLMLSGIGTSTHLKSLDIPVIEELPVGENLQDHPLMATLMMTLDFTKSNESPEESMFNFLMGKKSSYSQLGMGSFAAFIDTETEEKQEPNIEILFLDFNKNESFKLTKLLTIFGIRDDIQTEYLEINKHSYSIMIFASLLKPNSKGKIELKSADPAQYPKITAGYFSDETDISTYLKTYDFLFRLTQTESLKSMNAKIHEIKVPGCMQYPFASRTYRECALRHLTTTTYHQCGTCKMGPVDSPDSVVDPQLRVKGINGLRVMDASVMPRIPNGHTNSPVIMLAEKGSDYVKEYWHLKKDSFTGE